jgi:hypothetical protein
MLSYGSVNVMTLLGVLVATKSTACKTTDNRYQWQKNCRTWCSRGNKEDID